MQVVDQEHQQPRIGKKREAGGEKGRLASLRSSPVQAPRESSGVHVLNKTYLGKLYWTIDVVVAVSVLSAVLLITNFYRIPGGVDEFLSMRVTVKNLLLLSIFSVLWLVTCNFFGLYDQRLLSTRRNEIIRIIKACSLGSVVALIFPLMSISGAFRFHAVGYLWLLMIPTMISTRLLIRVLTVHVAPYRNQLRHLIIVGSGPLAFRLYQEFCDKRCAGYKFLGFVDSENHHPVPLEVHHQTLGTLDQLENILMSRVVDEVIIALPIKSCYNQIQSVIHICERVGVEAKYLSDLFQYVRAKPRFEQAEQFNVITMKLAEDDYRLVIKRTVDVAGALCGVALLSPLLLLIAAIIKMTSKGPVIFTQNRYGRNKRLFKMYKFRTMVCGAESLQASLEEQNEAAGPVFKMRNDPRIMPIGKFLRRSSLDELPQLLNVLRGEMSLVGPRPLPLRDVSRFNSGILMRRFCVLPGLTCLWQITGRSETDFDRWIELDLKYIDEWSLSLDAKILAKTIPAVLKGVGAA